MKEFGSLTAFAAELAILEAGVVFELEKSLDAVAKRVKKTAKEEIGEYQDAVGPFPAWAELAEMTKEDRVRKGFTENDPGLRTGQMRDSIKHQTKGLEAAIGSNDDRLVKFELGGPRQPPRPVLGPAAERNQEVIKEIVGGAVVKLLLGTRAIGYVRKL